MFVLIPSPNSSYHFCDTPLGLSKQLTLQSHISSNTMLALCYPNYISHTLVLSFPLVPLLDLSVGKMDENKQPQERMVWSHDGQAVAEYVRTPFSQASCLKERVRKRDGHHQAHVAKI